MKEQSYSTPPKIGRCARGGQKRSKKRFAKVFSIAGSRTAGKPGDSGSQPELNSSAQQIKGFFDGWEQARVAENDGAAGG